jgi:hypothetical protein
MVITGLTVSRRVLVAIEFEVGGFSANRTVDEQLKARSISTMKGKSTGQLDVIINGDATNSILALLKQVAQALVELETPETPSPEWDELLKVPQTGTPVTISIGLRADFEENVVE